LCFKTNHLKDFSISSMQNSQKLNVKRVEKLLR
jgi:hypothetical protein